MWFTLPAQSVSGIVVITTQPFAKICVCAHSFPCSRKRSQTTWRVWLPRKSLTRFGCEKILQEPNNSQAKPNAHTKLISTQVLWFCKVKHLQQCLRGDFCDVFRILCERAGPQSLFPLSTFLSWGKDLTLSQIVFVCQRVDTNVFSGRHCMKRIVLCQLTCVHSNRKEQEGNYDFTWTLSWINIRLWPSQKACNMTDNHDTMSVPKD